MLVEVIIPLALRKNYTWSVPAALERSIVPGIRVEVTLGKSKHYAGIVKRTIQEIPEGFIPKDIVQVLDDEPIVSALQLQWWEWMASYYLCTEGEVMQAAIPANLKMSSESILCWNEMAPAPDTSLSEQEYLLAEALELRKSLKIAEIQELLDITNVYRVIRQLIDKDYAFIWEEMKEKYQPKQVAYILLHPSYRSESTLEHLLNNWGKAGPKQLELLLAFIHLQQTEGEVTRTDLLEKSGASSAQLKALLDKGILLQEKRNEDRIPAGPKNISLPFILSSAQQSALQQIHTVWQENNVCLLHGVTSSGKTEIYTSLIPSLLEQGKQILYMLPEIALTAQIIRRLQRSLGGYVCVYHSRFNANERVEIWNRVKSGEPIVVLGARSALMLPFHQLDLIICDEEHDASYKQQDPAPRYHARDAAIYLAQLCGARVLLGSATPSLESYTNSIQNKYGLVTLTERYNQVELPPIQIIDNHKTEKSTPEDRIITPALQAAITNKLAKNEQVILFQNRRGYDPYQICQTCGWIPGCRDCNVSLTFHKFKHRLICHYCGQQYAPVTVCNVCGMHDFSRRNFGTEKIEEIITGLFPQARVARMDQDAVKGKHQHNNLIQQFEQHELDILIGTQMVVKGLHFDKVNLVGILDADALLQFADFRVNERAFQLIEQVSGRAGRTAGEGLVLVQAGQIHHPVLSYAQQHDYVGFYRDELPKRKEFGYPPFTRLIRFYCKHREDNLAGEAARHLHSILHQLPGCRILDPAQPPVNRVRNQYIWELLLKIPREGIALGKIKHSINQAMLSVQSNPSFSRVRIYADVDPV